MPSDSGASRSPSSSAAGLRATPSQRPVNQLQVLSTDSPQARFWSRCYGLAADSSRVVFANDLCRAKGPAALHARIRREVEENDISLLFIELTAALLDPFFLDELKREFRLRIALLTLDDEYKFDAISSSYATIADLVLATDSVSAERYRQAGVDASFFIMPVAVTAPGALPEEEEGEGPRLGVTFVGRIDRGKPGRARFVEFLEKNNIPVRFFASRGLGDSRFLSNEEMYAVFRNSAINLNFTGITTYTDRFNSVLYRRIRGMKLRPLEIMGAGGFCLSEHSVALEKLFRDGEELVFFRHKDELLDRIRHFLGHPEEARAIAARGARKVRDEFSSSAVSERLARLLRACFEREGIDLYGESQKLEVSRWLASNLVVTTMTAVVEGCSRGQLRHAPADVFFLFKFIGKLRRAHGPLFAARMLLLLCYRGLRETQCALSARVFSRFAA